MTIWKRVGQMTSARRTKQVPPLRSLSLRFGRNDRALGGNSLRGLGALQLIGVLRLRRDLRFANVSASLRMTIWKRVGQDDKREKNKQVPPLRSLSLASVGMTDFFVGIPCEA